MGNADLRGLGPLGVYAHFVAEAEYGKPLNVRFERGDGSLERETTLPNRLWMWPPLPASLGFAFTGLFLLFRAPPSPLTRSMSRASLLLAIGGACPMTGSVAVNGAGIVMSAIVWSLAYPWVLRALLIFTRGAAPTSAWGRVGPWLFVVIGPLGASQIAGFPFGQTIVIPISYLVYLAYVVTILVLVALTYRWADAVKRRQIRWLVAGFYGGLAPLATVIAVILVDQVLFGEWLRFFPLVWPSVAFTALIPLSILFAIARYNLFDIDRLLSATASYNVVLVILIGAGLVLVPWFGELSSGLLGFDPRVGQVALSLALAAVIVPAHQRLRPRIDRAFFKERYALDHGIADLLHSLSACENPSSLTQQVGDEIVRLLRPEACVVYAGAGESFAPVFVKGRGVPPVFQAGSALVAALRERRQPLALSSAGRTPDAAELGPFDRAALEALQAEVVVPVRRDESLLAFLCLGPKRSGDVYTSTDLSQLAAVAEAVSSQLRRFDQEQMTREAREMQESLRRYVPGAVAEQLASGAELAPCERRVSVLFVDLRGYTSFAEARRAEEIFSTVNRYTETVSQIVSRHGGSVVEFNGDGMMAVFGAPRELAAKERAAVAAGREIIEAVGALRIENVKGHAPQLSAGVGIATGEAFVGSIRAADRMIWSAIGNTTNLAARLESLSRELHAALVIDAATWETLGEQGADFRRHDAVVIRGREQPEEIYSLRL